MSKNYALLASRAFDRPLLLEPKTGTQFLKTVSSLLNMSASQRLEVSDNLAPKATNKYGALMGQFEPKQIGEDTAYYSDRTTAIVPIDGVLVHRNYAAGSYCGMVGYDGLASTLSEIQNNEPTIKTVVLDINSPGGEVAGIDNASAAIESLKASGRTVIAIVDNMAASAAYWLASAAHEIIATPTADTGSIGVYIAHEDISRAADAAGLKVTYIYSGDHKVDGNPYEPLPAAVREEMQAKVNQLHKNFAAHVAQGRSLPVAQILATEGRLYNAQDAQQQGLIDHIMSLPEAYAYATSKAAANPSPQSPTRSSKGAAHMTTSQPIGTATAAAATDPSIAQAVQAERQRMAAVHASPAVKGREHMANNMLATTDLSAEQIINIIALAPAAQAAPAALDQAAVNAAALALLNTAGGTGVAANGPQQPVADTKRYSRTGNPTDEAAAKEIAAYAAAYANQAKTEGRPL
jgi:capsid assembly protease